jgi:HAD superfamily hydrolase (TIGR01459 family)
MQTQQQLVMFQPPEHPQPGLAAIAGRYKGFIIDLWGVVHDGENPHPGALDALRRLRSGGRICLLSNSPRRQSDVAARLEAMGIGPDLYDHVVTSGELTLEALTHPPDAWHEDLGRRYLHLGPSHGFGMLAALQQTQVESPGLADFVLATGTCPGETVAAYLDVLSDCARLGRPLLCANPDLIVHVGNEVAVCAGSLAKHYEALGGETRYYGKPHSPAYRRCLELLGLGPDEILAIGDGLPTDIAGGMAAGIDVAFVTSGIHCAELDTVWGSLPNTARLAALLDSNGLNPRFVLPALTW